MQELLALSISVEGFHHAWVDNVAGVSIHHYVMFVATPCEYN